MRFLLAVAASIPLFAACHGYSVSNDSQRRVAAQDAISHWSDHSRLMAAKTIDEYGPPDEIEAGRLVWYKNGPFKRTEVWDFAVTPETLEQTVSYHVPDSKREALQAFRWNISVTPGGRELSSRAASEQENILALNLAAEIITGYTDPAEARKVYAQTMDLMASGKDSALTRSLLFPPEP